MKMFYYDTHSAVYCFMEMAPHGWREGAAWSERPVACTDAEPWQSSPLLSNAVVVAVATIDCGIDQRGEELGLGFQPGSGFE